MSKFTIVITFLVLPLLYSSCSKNEAYDDDFYVLLNDILIQYDNSAVVIDKPMNYKIYNHNDFLNIPPPPNGYNSVSIMDNEFKWFIDEKYLNIDDSSAMMTQARDLSKLIFDTSKINMKLIKKEIIDTVYDKSGKSNFWEKLNTVINSYNVIFISKPLFNVKATKVYFQIDYFCGGLCGYGMIYLCEKRNNKWQIIYKVESWIS